MADTAVAEKKEWTTALSEWSKTVTGLVERDFQSVGVQFDEYSKTCAMSAVSAIYQLVKNTDKMDMNKLDTSNLRDIVTRCASLKLNANSMPREVYFQLRSKNVNGTWVKEIEMGVEGDGNDALLRNFGTDVEFVYPVWLVKEGDDFIYPKRRGIETIPPEWDEKGLSQKVVRVVYPIKMKSGNIQYLIAERDSVKVNLLAHIRNNLLNETFGLVKSGKRFDATEEEKRKINEKKAEILNAVKACKTVDEMLAVPSAQPYISAAWTDSTEAMIVRKMRNNATKMITKNLNSVASNSLLQMDEAYQASQAEIAENANKEELVIEADAEETFA